MSSKAQYILLKWKVKRTKYHIYSHVNFVLLTYDLWLESTTIGLTTIDLATIGLRTIGLTTIDLATIGLKVICATIDLTFQKKKIFSSISNYNNLNFSISR